MRTLLAALAVMLVAMSETGCRYANTVTSHDERKRHVNSVGGERLNIGEGVTAIRYYEFGAPGLEDEDYLAIDIKKKTLHYEIGCYLWSKCQAPEIKAKFNYVCNDAEWRFVVSNLNSMAVTEWKARYDNEEILDGTSWRLEFCSGPNVVREYGGSNAWPEKFSHWGAVRRFVRNHPDFVAAYPKIAEEDREYKEWVKHFLDSLGLNRNVDPKAATNLVNEVEDKMLRLKKPSLPPPNVRQ